MKVQLPSGVEVDVDGEAVALRDSSGRAILQVIEDEAAELGSALLAGADVLRRRRVDAGPAVLDVAFPPAA